MTINMNKSKGGTISEHNDTTTLSTFTSRSMARKTLEQIAVSGEYTADGYSDGFVRYVRVHDNMKEEVTGKKLNERSYAIIITQHRAYKRENR